jgi:AraC family transcriptional regulator of adaptative response/methylated-DNA-[protein]-cysteine methyltransferase
LNNDDFDAPSFQRNWIEKAREYIRANAEKKITLKKLSEETGVSIFHLQRTFKRVMGFSPREYQEACRIENLKMKLREKKTVSSVVHEAGYNSTSWLYSGNKSKLGMTPSEYRDNWRGMKIRYQIVDSPLDRLLVARTEHGVCYFGLWDNDEELEGALRKEYPAAEFIRENTSLDPWTRDILEYIIGRVKQLDNIPIDIHGTSFQLDVWKALLQIPKGSTRTYQDIAKAIRRPTAARAVDRAIRTNPVALLIPCHRIIRKSGEIGGYDGGVERKKILLKLEEA